MRTATSLDDLQTIDAAALGKLLGRSTKSVKVDASRRPETLPPRFQIPGTRKLRWRVVDVAEWMERIASMEKQKRMREEEARKRMSFLRTPS